MYTIWIASQLGGQIGRNAPRVQMGLRHFRRHSYQLGSRGQFSSCTPCTLLSNSIYELSSALPQQTWTR